MDFFPICVVGAMNSTRNFIKLEHQQRPLDKSWINDQPDAWSIYWPGEYYTCNSKRRKKKYKAWLSGDCSKGWIL